MQQRTENFGILFVGNNSTNNICFQKILWGVLARSIVFFSETQRKDDTIVKSKKDMQNLW